MLTAIDLFPALVEWSTGARREQLPIRGLIMLRPFPSTSHIDPTALDMELAT